MTKIEAIRKYFDKCPFLDAQARINIDYIGAEAIEYSIYTEPIDPVYKTYADGGKLKQFGFTFTTLTYHGAELMQQIENSGFYDDFTNWIDENNKNGVLPEINGALRIEILTNGYLINAEADLAQYQIQLKLIYMEV